jgi:hypothetical protein
MTPEGRVKRMVKKALDEFGPDCHRFMPVQTGYGSPGLDFHLCVRGRAVYIETKAPGKKLTALQEGTKAAIEAAGGIVLVVWDEGSLAIAMKIMLALEFDNGRHKVLGALSHWLDRATAKETKAYYEEYCSPVEPAAKADDAVGRDHGAPGAAPQRRSE